MMQATDAEKEAAKVQLPKPLREFIDSEELKTAYADIQKELNLNLRQMGVVMESATLALLGLSPQANLENSLHTELTELSPDTFQKVVAKMDEKIFQPARARLKGED